MGEQKTKFTPEIEKHPEAEKLVCFKKTWLYGVIFLSLLLGIYISPYVRGFARLMQEMKEQPLQQVGIKQKIDRTIANTTEGCPEVSEVQLYIKK